MAGDRNARAQVGAIGNGLRTSIQIAFIGLLVFGAADDVLSAPATTCDMTAFRRGPSWPR